MNDDMDFTRFRVNIPMGLYAMALARVRRDEHQTSVELEEALGARIRWLLRAWVAAQTTRLVLDDPANPPIEVILTEEP